MPWYNGDYPPSYNNQPKKLREKAVEIANEVLKDGADEGMAIATGLKRAREFFAKKREQNINQLTNDNKFKEEENGRTNQVFRGTGK
ncbi:hypothetical protein [Mucilaginibacter sp.]|jgi:uncharacterized protein YdaT|uniref:hypothetical protein n=1 Tax=Mucilaginibacter sp. TaxID=1882438 RepID=UPI0035683B10